MLRDFSKINTFLTVVRQKSFSKASKKLGISQPAVTQQIKLLESYLKSPLVDRKKNGIGLTEIGKEFFKIAQKIDRFLDNTEKEVTQIIDKKIPLTIGASSSIANNILPLFLGNIKDIINSEVSIKVSNSRDLIDMLLSNKINIALVSSNTPHKSIIYKEWILDELVLCSKSKLPQYVTKDDFYKYRWLTRGDESNTHNTIQEYFLNLDIDYNKFNLVSTVNSSSIIKQTILKTDVKNDQAPLVAFLSKSTLKDEIANKEIYVSRLKKVKFGRKLYIAYLKDNKQNALIDLASNYILKEFKL